MTMTDSLPPDTRREPDGRLVHLRVRFQGWLKRDGLRWQDSDGEEAKYEEDHEIIPHPCIIGMEDESDRQLMDKKNEAAMARADFYHPRLGWLTNGVKRVTEWPENLGTSVIVRERRRTRVQPTDEGAPRSRRTRVSPSDDVPATSELVLAGEEQH